MADREVVIVRVERVEVSDGAPWQLVVGTRRFGNSSTGTVSPRFRNRTIANRLGAELHDAYVSEGRIVEFTRARADLLRKVVKR